MREVDRLFQEASKTTLKYEKSMRAVTKQRSKVAKLRKSVRREKRKLTVLRGKLGRMAAQQYRSGGGGLGNTAELLLTRSPADLLQRVELQGKGEDAADRLYTAADLAKMRIEAEQRRATGALGRLNEDLDERRKLKKSLEKRLATAQAKLEKLQAAEAKKAKNRSQGCDTNPKKQKYVPDGSDDKGPSGRKWRKPVQKYQLTAHFGESSEHWSQRHTGLDFAVPWDRPVTSVGYGTVHAVGCDGSFGNNVTIKHDDGYYTFYAHLAEIHASPGRRVFPGETLGLSGSTGNSNGPHLHFEVRMTPQFGSGIDPERWLKGKGLKP
ncbi:peptidoglycan DD-metalloendopeptidase family protein [Streptomyces sp. A7024]|uniref:Peptidoglycan DD-metalloendopeptidase family protein n=2 Tax=Streptomyces coryli TaxID=1128680 RepID=A0A6G4TWA7_9ACTN|nr:peptidoglycan DD-metalloendopeptidase family protein [Streptomyces coryli]